MALFYAPDILSTFKLDEEESNHAIKVLRMKAGDSLQIVDGKGGYYEARISDPNHKRCGVEIVESFSEFEKRPYRLHIAIAPTKNIEILVQTGGTKNFRNTALKDGETQRFRITDNKVESVEVLDGVKMCDPKSLGDFLVLYAKCKEKIVFDS
jgi:hypothetical protein